MRKGNEKWRSWKTELNFSPLSSSFLGGLFDLIYRFNLSFPTWESISQTISSHSPFHPLTHISSFPGLRKCLTGEVGKGQKKILLLIPLFTTVSFSLSFFWDTKSTSEVKTPFHSVFPYVILFWIETEFPFHLLGFLFFDSHCRKAGQSRRRRKTISRSSIIPSLSPLSVSLTILFLSWKVARLVSVRVSLLACYASF